MHADVRAGAAGTVLEVLPRPLGEALIALGGGRTMMHQPIDPGVGFEVRVRPGDAVAKGDPLGAVHAKDEAGVRLGTEALRSAVRIGAAGDAVVRRPLVGQRVE